VEIKIVKSPSQLNEKLNRVSILERLDGNEELLAELIQLFLEEAPLLIATMREALQKADMPTLGRTAHSMKGAASNFLAYGVANAALNLEKETKNGDIESSKASLAALESALERLLPELANLCQGSVK
jgi:two-component system sensor histidine kinase/response regulator